MSSADDEFTVFAEAASSRLMATAFLLCGDWHTAEDLAQTTLAKVFAAWWRIRSRDAVHAYAQRTLLNTYLAHYRRRQRRETLTADVAALADRVVEPQTPELRLALIDALATLPPKARAVVILRYWEDMSIDQVAALLGCSPGNVKSQSARALDKLRLLLEGGPADAGSSTRVAKDSQDIREARNGRNVAPRAL
jgi:RNA polymerase sigma-70 factor (sigma-E family)